MNRNAAAVSHRAPWAPVAALCLVAATAVAFARQREKPVDHPWHLSTSIDAAFGSFYMLNGDVFVSSPGEISVTQPGASAPKLLGYHHAIFTFAGGQWLPREGAGQPMQAPQLCDGDNQLNADIAGLDANVDKMPPTARVKDALWLGEPRELAIVYSTPNTGMSPSPHAYPLWLLISNPATNSEPMSLGDDGLYCGALFGTTVRADYLAILRDVPSAVIQRKDLQLFWSTPSSLKPTSSGRH